MIHSGQEFRIIFDGSHIGIHTRFQLFQCRLRAIVSKYDVLIAQLIFFIQNGDSFRLFIVVDDPVLDIVCR
ncbi:hypothetical protein D3C87_1266620 [compost metagenome]